MPWIDFNFAVCTPDDVFIPRNIILLPVILFTTSVRVDLKYFDVPSSSIFSIISEIMEM